MTRNRLYLFALLAFVSSLSCKKFIEKEEQAALVSAITNGSWEVNQYTAGKDEITAEFSGYLFQFADDGIVHAVNGNVSISGIWIGNIVDKTITSEFPAAGEPLTRLNGVWKITDSAVDFVKARMPGDAGENMLHLVKKK